MKGGPEANLVAARDGKVRLMSSEITSTAYKLESIKKEHIEALIDNRAVEPICLLEKTDYSSKALARKAMGNFLVEREHEYRSPKYL